MAGSVPWSVNAVDPEAWADARDAARRSGQSVGEWLETAIRNTANDRERPHPARNESGAIERRLDDIAERIELFSRQREQPTVRPARGDTALLSSIEALNQRVDALSREMRAGEKNGPAEVRVAIQKLEDRIEHLLSHGRIAEAGASPELERKLEGISHSIEAMSRQLMQENVRHEYEGSRYEPAPVPSSVEELDNAVAEIMMRQAVLDGTPPPRAIPRRAPRAETARPEASREQEKARDLPQPDFSGLERQLKHMTEEMQALRKSALQNEALGALRAEIADLAGKLAELAPRRSLESIERAIDSIALRVDRAGGTRQDETLTEVVDALHDIRSALADVRPAESFVSVEKDLHALSTKLDHLGGRGIDSGAVAQLQEQTAEIRDLLSGALPSDVLRALVDQIELLVAKFEERRNAPDSALLDVMNAFDRRIEALSERIEAATRQAPSAPALDEIRRRLDELQDALTHEGEGGRIEATLHALAQKVDATDARLGNLASIERGLSDLFAQLEEARASAQEAAERAAKSAMREMAAAQPAPVEFTRRVAGEPLETRYTSAVELQPAAAVRETPRPELRPVSSLRPIVAADMAEEIAPDMPLEPGSGAPRLRLQSAALRVAQSEAALGDLAVPSAETPVRTSDFIAAARRAAQAANAEPEAEPKKPGASAVGRISSILGRSRRAILIALTLCLLAFVAFRLFDGLLPNPFRSAAPTAPAPTIVAPKANTSAIPTPAPQAALPAEQEVHVQAPAGEAFAATPPAGVLGGDGAPHFFGETAPAPETTGSTNARKSTTGSIQTAAAPAANTAAEPENAASALPAALGTTALRAAAIGGDPVAAYEIGVRYLDGRGVRADAAEAAKWLEQAYAKGSIPAAYRLGSIHEKGLNGRKNPAEALRYYKTAAEGGNIKAMHNLAVIHAEGAEGQADLKSALRWFRMAAERGVRDSQYNLGVLYARGLGVEQNFAESYRWFAIAANQGDGDAGKKRDDVAKRLDVQTLVAARLAVQTWVAAKTEPSANEVALKPEWDEAPARKRSVKK